MNSEKIKNWRGNGIAVYNAGLFHEAQEIYSEILKIDPGNKAITIRLYNSRGASSMRLGNLQEAIEDFTEALKLNPKFVESLIGRAICHCKLEYFEEAIKDYEAALKLEKTEELEEDLKSARLQLVESYKSKDYYKILRVPKTATDQEIKAVFHKLALAHNPEEEEKFKGILEAYTALMDPDKRLSYDNGH
jgi:DnaJ family protein C protein 7